MTGLLCKQLTFAVDTKETRWPCYPVKLSWNNSSLIPH